MKWVMLILGGGCLLFAFGSIATCGTVAVGVGEVAKKSEEERKAREAAEATAPVSNITLESLMDDFRMGSTTTKIQQEELFKPLKGKKVQWQAKVYDITEMFGNLKIQTKTGSLDRLLTVFVTLTDAERSKALKYKENDSIRFVGVGVLDDYGMGSLQVVRASIVE